jgi:hypothetical protein
MTETQRIERGRRAQMALDEFIDPAFGVVIATYRSRLEELAAKEPWSHQKITALANAVRIAEAVRAQVAGLVYEGEHAKAQKVRAEEIEKLSPAKRRFLNMVA